jgi:hypothetical protein
MKIRTIISRSLLLLLMSATATGAAPTEGASGFTAFLAYPHQSRSPERSHVFRSHGESYRFGLVPDWDTEGHLIVFELVLERASHSGQPENLLDPTGMIHGYQKWTFGATDFAHGPGKSGYGTTRIVDLPKRGLSVRIDVLRVAVKPTPATSSVPARYRFTQLTVRVQARPASDAAR